MNRPLVPRIHARGDAARLDAVLELVAFTARPHPLNVSLDELPRRMAKVFEADVCSIYLLEGEELVMRGNVGFKESTLGEIRLQVGEGITGQAVEYLRPISLEVAPAHSSYRHFPSLGEENFPIFLAVPIPGPKGVLGALVLQRRKPPAFSHADVELASALTAPVAAIAERARLVDALRRNKKAVPGGHRVLLSGKAVVPGKALGAVATLPRPSEQGPRAHDARTPELALEQARKQLSRTLVKVQEDSKGAPELRFLSAMRTILEDGRLQERALELADKSGGLTHGLVRAGTDALRAARRSGEPFGLERAQHIAEVCEALALLTVLGPQTRLPSNAVLVGDHFSLSELVMALRAKPVAIVLSEHATSKEARALLSAVGVPAVVAVAGLRRWTADAEVALVDADHGLVHLNPSRTEVASFRDQHGKKKPPRAAAKAAAPSPEDE